MKKFLLSILFILLSSQVGFAEINNAKELHIYLRKNFVYTQDVVTKGHQEYIQRPEILEYSKAGDCDDFSVYTWARLTQLNYYAQPYVLFLEINGEIVGHAITVFLDEDSTYSIFSNQWIIVTNQVNPVDAIKEAYPSWIIIYRWQPNHFGQVTSKDFQTEITVVSFRNVEVLKFFQQKNKSLIK